MEECQATYDHEVASRLRHYRAQNPAGYRELTAAHDPNYWILAENRAKELKQHSHSYGNLIQRKL